MKHVNPFYKSKQWQHKKEMILRRNDYLSLEGKQFGRSEQAEVVHHIYPLEHYPELALVDWNLMPVTNSEHNTFHDRTGNKIVGRGIYWQKKRQREFNKFYENRM